MGPGVIAPGKELGEASVLHLVQASMGPGVIAPGKELKIAEKDADLQLQWGRE